MSKIHAVNSQSSIKQRLLEAEAQCAAQGEKLTPLRRKVLELIYRNGKAVKAYELIRLISTEEKDAKPPTVYRTLDFLLKTGLIHRVAAIDAFMACHHPHHHEASQILICGQCGDVQEREGGGFDKALRDLSKANSFRPLSHTIEIQGLCAHCQNDKQG